MLVDEKIDVRNKAYAGKDFALSDRLRNELDEELVFIFDHPQGKHEVLYLTEKYFERMNVEKFKTKRLYVEHRLRLDRKADDLLNAWLASTNASMKEKPVYVKDTN